MESERDETAATDERPAGRHGRPAEVTATSAGLDALAPAWAALPGMLPFHHPDWHAAWLRHFGAGAEPIFLAFQRAEELVGVAALDLATPGRAVELGDHNVRDYAGPVAVPGAEREVAGTLLEWLNEDYTPALRLWGLRDDAPVTRAFGEVAEGLGWACEAVPDAICPALDLPASFDEYLAALDKHERHELRRKIRNLEAAGRLELSSATSPGDVAEALPLLFALMRASRADKAALLTPAMEAFMTDIATAFAAREVVRLSMLRLSGEPIAALLAFETAGTTYLYNSGYDPAYSPLAAGVVSKALAIRDAIERGQQRFDFLRGEEPYKYRLGGQPRHVVTLELRRFVP